MRERTAWMDVARGMAVSLVVLYHVTESLYSDGLSVAPWLDHANDLLVGFRMPVIVMISGLLAARVRTWSWPEVLRRRIGPLALFYVVWTPITVIGMEWLADGKVLLEGGILKWMFVRPEWLTWYFFALVLWIAAARAFRSVPTAVLLAVALALNLFAVAWLFNQNLVGGFESWGYVFRYWLFFIAAERFARLYHRLAAVRSGWLGALCAVLFVGFGVVTQATRAGENPLALLILGALGTGFALTVVPLFGESKAVVWVRAVGKRTLGIYAMQALVIEAIFAVLNLAVPASALGGWLMPLAVAVAAVAISYGIARLLLRFAPVPFLRPWWDSSSRADTAVQPDASSPAQ